MSQTTSEVKRPTQRSEMTKWQWTWKEIKRNKTAYFMLAPFFILFILFTVLPVFLSVIMSFTDFNMLQTPNIVWLDNYERLFLNDEICVTAIKNTIVFAVIIG